MAVDLTPFDNAMFGIYHRAKKEAGYTASKFLDMLTKQGGLVTAKQLINAAQPSSGYAALHLRNRLDLTVEALVVESLHWRNLFTPEEIARAEHRLAKHEYAFKAPA